jgi:hypothetical protein
MAAKESESTQADKFRDLARELETDDDEKAFEEKVRTIARAPAPERSKDD